MESQVKLNKKYMSFSTSQYEGFEGTFYKEYKMQLLYQFLYSLLFYIASEFISADTIYTTL